MRNVLPGVNFYCDETKFEAIAKGRSTLYTISFSDVFHFPFLRVLYINLWSGVLPSFFFRRREKKVPFPLASYVVNNPILHLIIYIQLRSIPFLSISRDHLPYAEHIGDHLRSRTICDLLGIFCMQSGDHLQYWTLLSGPMTFMQNSQNFFIHVLDLRVTFCCSNYHDEKPF